MTKDVVDFIEASLVEIVNRRIHSETKLLSRIAKQWKTIKCKIVAKLNNAKHDLLNKFTGIQSGIKYQQDFDEMYLYRFDDELSPDLKRHLNSQVNTKKKTDQHNYSVSVVKIDLF
jgi:dethiobiotin synthetase